MTEKQNVTTKRKSLRAAVIGLGVGRVHAEAFHDLPDVELVALCDANPVRLADIGRECDVAEDHLFTDYKEMLKAVSLDVVSVCLPNALHPDVSIACMEAGAHVICEKPMAINTSEAERMSAASDRTGRKLMIVYNFRYRPDSLWLYDLVRGGQLGRVYHVNISWRREAGIPGAGYGWFGNGALSGGGALIDLGVHVIDLILWMLDFPAVQTVSGEVRNEFGRHGRKVWGVPSGEANDRFDVEDGATAFIRLDGGVNVFLQTTWAEHARPGEDRLRVELQGTGGTVVLDIPNYTREDTLRYYTEIEGAPVTVVPKVRWYDGVPYIHPGYLAAAVRSLHGEGPPPSDAEQGLVTVRILEAIYESARAGREVIVGQRQTTP